MSVTCVTPALLMVITFLVGCGGDSAGSGSPFIDKLPTTTPLPVADGDPSPTLETPPQADAVVGFDLVEGIDVPLEFESAGVEFRVVEFSVTPQGQPAIQFLVANNSDETIRNVDCDVDGLLDNRIVESMTVRFAVFGPVSPGESAAASNEWRELDNGFAAFDQIRYICDFINGESSTAVDVSSGPIDVSFVEYTSQSSRPAVTLRITNNSTFTIYNASCQLEAKRDLVIVDVARLFFADQDDIRPGEAAEDTGAWSNLSSLEDFDSDPFDPANLNCSYLVRD